MILNHKKINKLFFYWLWASLLLIFSIVIVGGLTRLTDSGLSITEWELFSGILPPLNTKSWNNYFELYKQIPQYKLLNFDMSIDEFKVIFYWEYFHRILARIIGLFFLIPLIFFLITKKINKKYLKICFLILILIIAQGIIGWFMVKSGLISDITVSHYRLSLHLTFAILIISTIFWLIKNFESKKYKIFYFITKDNLPFQLLILFLYMQIVMGTFVSGLDAGKIYQTWPLMGQTFIPDDIYFLNLQSILDFHNHSLVQFYHRIFAYLIILYVLLLCIYIYKNKILKLYYPLKILLSFLFFQILLGILTLLSEINIYLASLHQITGILLVLSAINLYYLRAK